MNNFITSIFELGLFVVIAIMTVFLTKYILTAFYRKKTGEDFPYQNLAFMIFMSSSIFSVAWLMIGILNPLSGTLELLMSSDLSTGKVIFEYSKFLGLFLVLGYLIGVIINFIAYKLFTALTTKLDEFDEIKNGNVGVAILASVFIIMIALFCREPFVWFLESLIPYPDLPGFY